LALYLVNFGWVQQALRYQFAARYVRTAQQCMGRRPVNGYLGGIWQGCAPSHATQEAGCIVLIQNDGRVMRQQHVNILQALLTLQRRQCFQLSQCDALLLCEVTRLGAAQGTQMSHGSQRLGNVLTQGANVGTLAAQHINNDS
jgi:hypothetical protein